MTTTAYVWLGMIIPALIWEGYSVVTGDVSTISQTWQMIGQQWSAFYIYAVAVLPGHFWVQPPDHMTLASQLQEPAEVAMVLWCGWALFVVEKAKPDVFPLPWWGNLLLIIGATLIGAFAWTISA